MQASNGNDNDGKQGIEVEAGLDSDEESNLRAGRVSSLSRPPGKVIKPTPDEDDSEDDVVPKHNAAVNMAGLESSDDDEDKKKKTGKGGRNAAVNMAGLESSDDDEGWALCVTLEGFLYFAFLGNVSACWLLYTLCLCLLISFLKYKLMKYDLAL